MSKFKSIISRASSVKNLIFLFLSSHLILLTMLVFTFPIINNQIRTKAFDLQTFGYSVGEAKTIVNSLNDQVTNLYLFPQISLLDVLYPFLLALFLSSFIFRLSFLTKRNVNSAVLIIPFLAMLFDYLENICISLMITKSVDTSEVFVLISSSFTLLKSLLTTVS
jgi:hypothetical protein